MGRSPEGLSAVLDELYAVIQSRRGADPKASYVAKVLARGPEKIAKKVGEEALETALAAVQSKRGEVISESADLLFHLLVLWADAGIQPREVFAELKRRRGVSGLVEKARRAKA